MIRTKKPKQIKIKEFRARFSTEKDAETCYKFLERIIMPTLDKNKSMGIGINRDKKLVWVRI